MPVFSQSELNERLNERFEQGEQYAAEKCVAEAESMIGSPTEDDLQKFINWMRVEFDMPASKK